MPIGMDQVSRPVADPLKALPRRELEAYYENLERQSPVLMETSLAEQVKRYYEQVPGGFSKVVADALAAQKDRSPELEVALQDAPPWSRKELYRKVPIRRQAWAGFDPPLPGRDVWPTGGGYYIQRGEGGGEVFMGLPEDWEALGEKRKSQTASGPPHPDESRRTLPIEHFFARSAETPWYAMPDYHEPIEQHGRVVAPPSYKSQEQVALEHELSHSAYLSGRPISLNRGSWRKPIPGGMGRDRDWDYRTTGIEHDPRLAEIKRAYSSATGKPVRTMEDAEDAWNWWGQYIEHGGYGRKGRVGSGWSKDIWDRIENRPKEKQKSLQRMRELVRSQLHDALLG